MLIEQARPATADEWDDAWQRSSTATFFHSRAWAEVWEEAGDGRWRAAPEFLRFRDGRSAVFPFSLRRRMAGMHWSTFSSPEATYGGWEDFRVLRAEIDESRSRDGRIYLRVVLSYAFHDPRGRWRTEDDHRVVLAETPDGLRYHARWR